ncbi:MAG: class I SAM-dependent methyltransferase [Pseudomonadota bacterium]
MDRYEIQEKMAKVVADHGDWSGHNVDLGSGVFTIDENDKAFQSRADAYARIIADLSGQPWANLRILDLACLEGGFALEFAKLGAQSVGIEIREPNLAKAEFAKEALALSNCQFYRDDVRKLSRESYGEFDVILCTGILYHLDAPDVFPFIEAIHATCRGFAIFDTHCAMLGKVRVAHKGQYYSGTELVEHYEQDSQQVREARNWASIDNVRSFWPTEKSLLDALSNSGFSTILKVQIPSIWTFYDRSVHVAIKGRDGPATPQQFVEATHLSPGFFGTTLSLQDCVALPGSKLLAFWLILKQHSRVRGRHLWHLLLARFPALQAIRSSEGRD